MYSDIDQARVESGRVYIFRNLRVRSFSDDVIWCSLVNPQRTCIARVTVVSLCVCVCVCVSVTSPKVRVQSKIRSESKCGTEGF